MANIIINADDFGASHNVNMGIVECFKYGLIDRTSIIVNGEASDEAAELANTFNFQDKVGLHFNITDGRPLCPEIYKSPLVNLSGDFSGEFWGQSFNRLFVNNKVKKQIRAELICQIEKFKDYGFLPQFFDSHKHTHCNLSVYSVIEDMLKNYGFRTVRLSRNIPQVSIKGKKSLYKKLINNRIIIINGSEGDNIRYFGSINDAIEEKKASGGFAYNTEIEVHPILKDNLLYDAMVCKELRTIISEIKS